MTPLDTDVCVIGSGPVGATVARQLIPRGARVMLVDAGGAFSPRPGYNLRNLYSYQQRPELFVDVVKGLLHPLSPSPSDTKRVAHANPLQRPELEPAGAATAYALGGMGIHWTCVTPRQHPELERAPFIDNWDALYDQAEAIIGTRHHGMFDRSVRHAVVKEALRAHYGDRLQAGFGVDDLPMAIAPVAARPEHFEWSGTDTVLAPVLASDRLQLQPECVITRLVHANGRVSHAEARHLQSGETFRINAKQFVLAAGTVLSAQLLWNSEVRPAALGTHLVEHPILYAQIELNPELQKKISTDPRFSRESAVAGDPLRLPLHDFAPNVWLPVSRNRPWHCQVTKEIVHFSADVGTADHRAVIDLRWYAAMETRPDNRVTFSAEHTDAMGMPQPTFEFTLSPADKDMLARMETDMREVAAALGSGWVLEPNVLPLGTCLHLQGACRMGERDDGASVVDANGKVWSLDNAYVVGNAVIPTTNACNPTLTAIALAVRTAQALARSLEGLT